MHLHPSGNLKPSKQDIAMTDRMQQAFSLMGIGIVDHIIIGDSDRYYSFREHCEMPVGKQHYTENLAEIDLKKAYPLPRESVLRQLKGAKTKVAERAKELPSEIRGRTPVYDPVR